jgi:formylmethanofuran dehydrogenase subunit D
MNGNVRIRRAEENQMREELGGIHNGDVAAWKYLDFKKGARKVSVKVKSDLGGEIILRADSQDGEILGSMTIPSAADWTVYESKVKTPKGVHALWMEFKGAEVPEERELMRVDWIEFTK